VKRCLVSIALVVLVACGKKPATSDILPVRVAIGGQAQLIYLAATMAEALDFYRDEKLDVTLIDFPGGQKSLEALLGGSTDVVCGFYDHTIVMAAENRQLREFVAMLRYPGLVAVAANPKIQTIEDLKGKIIGVSSAGSSTNFFLNYLMVKRGILPEQFSVASIGMSATAVAAITHHKVDAAIMTDPALEIVRRQTPAIKILADTRTAEGTLATFGVATYPSAVLYSTDAWIASHHEEAKRLARAILKTLAWMRSKTPQEIRARMPAAFRTEDEAADLEGLQSLKAMLSEDGKLSPESAAIVTQVLGVSLEKVRDARIDVSKTFTNQFVNQ
jgi:NitT/TauT family transport system substrate-binding protein